MVAAALTTFLSKSHRRGESILMTTTDLKLVNLTMAVLTILAGVAVSGLTSERQLQLASAPAGRIALHVLCAARDHRFGWHWRGVARELAL